MSEEVRGGDDEARRGDAVVDFLSASSDAEARVVMAVLRNAGIRCHVDGQLLQDEFAVSQRSMGLVGVTIQVARADLEAAREALLAARREGQALARAYPDDEDERGPDERPPDADPREPPAS